MQTAMTMPREGTDVKENAVIVRQGRSRRDFHQQLHHQTAANWSDKTSKDDAFGKVTTPSDAVIVRQDRGRSAICTGCLSYQSCRRSDLLRRRSVWDPKIPTPDPNMADHLRRIRSPLPCPRPPPQRPRDAATPQAVVVGERGKSSASAQPPSRCDRFSGRRLSTSPRNRDGRAPPHIPGRSQRGAPPPPRRAVSGRRRPRRRRRGQRRGRSA